MYTEKAWAYKVQFVFLTAHLTFEPNKARAQFKSPASFTALCPDFISQLRRI